MDLEKVREKWVNYNLELIDKFSRSVKTDQKEVELLKYFGVNFLIDFESELDEDPENVDGGIITIDTVTAAYIDSFLGRWYIQNNENATEEELEAFMDAFFAFYSYLRDNKLYKERAAQLTKLLTKLENKKKYVKRLKDYQKIQESKGDEETYLDLLQEWEYEDL